MTLSNFGLIFTTYLACYFGLSAEWTTLYNIGGVKYIKDCIKSFQRNLKF